MLLCFMLHHRLVVALIDVAHHVFWLEDRIVEASIGKVWVFKGDFLWFRRAVFDISFGEGTFIPMDLELDRLGMDDLRTTSTCLLLLGLLEFLS